MGFKNDLNISLEVTREYLKINFWRPIYESDSYNFLKLIICHSYPFIASTNMAFGPASTLPFINLVKWIPKKSIEGLGRG